MNCTCGNVIHHPLGCELSGGTKLTYFYLHNTHNYYFPSTGTYISRDAFAVLPVDYLKRMLALRMEDYEVLALARKLSHTPPEDEYAYVHTFPQW